MSDGPVIVTVEDWNGIEKVEIDRSRWNEMTSTQRTAMLNKLYGGNPNAESNWWVEDPDDEAATAN